MRIKLINFGYEKAPKRQFHNDAGADVRANENVQISPGRTRKIKLGFGLELPDGLMAIMMPRSGLTSQGVISHVPPIDSGYTGEAHAIITNNSPDTIRIRKGDRIAQIVIVPILLPEFVEVLGEERGVGAFGSTGVK